MSKTFKEQYLNTSLSFDKIHNWVDDWYNKTTTVTLQEYLGLTDQEMVLFIKGDNSLKKELDALRKEESEEHAKIAKEFGISIETLSSIYSSLKNLEKGKAKIAFDPNKFPELIDEDDE